MWGTKGVTVKRKAPTLHYLFKKSFGFRKMERKLR